MDARERATELFIKSGLMKLEDIAELQTLLVMFKAKSRRLPENIQTIFVFHSENKDHRGKFDLKHPYAQTTLKLMCISVCGVKLWNSLKTDLKVCTNIHQFKKM